MSESGRSILIAEYMPTLNKGGLELVEGILKTFENLGRTKVAIFSLYPSVDRKRFPPNMRLIDVCKDLHIERFLLASSENPRLLGSFLAFVQHLFFVMLYRLFGKNALNLMKKPLWQAYYFSNAIVACINEDDCVNGNYLKFSPVYISLLAKILHKPIVVYANSTTRTTNIFWVWRLRTRMLWRVLARYFLNNMSLITVRDKDTFELYGSLVGSNVPLYFTGDVGVLLDPANPKTIKKIMVKERIDKKAGLLIGASITRRLLMHAFSDCSDHNERYQTGLGEIAKVLDRLIAEYQVKVVFIPHCIERHRDNDDRVVGYDILRKMKNKSDVVIIAHEYTPQELKGIIGELDLLIGDRVHALVSALSMNVPCCILAYRSDKRPYNLVGKDFRQEKWIFEVDTFNTDTLYRLLTELIASSEEIRTSLPSITQQAKERALLNGRLLEALLSDRAPEGTQDAQNT